VGLKLVAWSGDNFSWKPQMMKNITLVSSNVYPMAPWEIVKEILIQEILEGRVTQMMGPKDIYVMQEG
jgi:hypothetical protein